MSKPIFKPHNNDNMPEDFFESSALHDHFEDIKIKEEYGNDIVKGIKKEEYRKLSSGIISGKKRFVSIERRKPDVDCEYCSFPNYPCSEHEGPAKIFGFANLKVGILLSFPGQKKSIIQSCITHKPSYDFVMKNYYNQHEFITYHISSIKDLNNVIT